MKYSCKYTKFERCEHYIHFVEVHIDVSVMNEIHNGKYLLIVFCPLNSLDLIFLSF